MAAERLSMRKTREVLRLAAAGQSDRIIATGLGIARSTVAECLARAQAAGLSWPLPPECSDAELEARLFPPPRAGWPHRLLRSRARFARRRMMRVALILR